MIVNQNMNEDILRPRFLLQQKCLDRLETVLSTLKRFQGNFGFRDGIPSGEIRAFSFLSRII
jgi:hypothetical protein